MVEELHDWFFATVIEQYMSENGLADKLLRDTLLGLEKWMSWQMLELLP